MPLDHNHVLLLRLLARENPSLSMSNWKELCEANNLSVDTTKQVFPAFVPIAPLLPSALVPPWDPIIPYLLYRTNLAISE